MTLRRRIIAGVAAILAACLGVAFVTIHRRVDSQLTRGIDRDLWADMDTFSSAIQRGGDPSRYLASQPFRATARLLYAVRPGETPQTNEPDLLDPDDAGLFRTPAGLSTRRLTDVGDLRLLVRRTGDGTLLGVGEPLEPVDRALDGVDQSLFVAGVLALIVAVLAGTGLSVGVTRPLRRMARIADAVDHGDLAPRMAQGSTHDEVGRLAASFDTMLDRLQAAFDGQQAFVAEASHELRTPLTVIRGQLEVLAAEPEPTRADVVRVEQLVNREVAHMSRLVDDLLVLAAPSVHPAAVDLPSFLDDLVATLQATTAKRLELAEVTALTVDADRDRLAQALRNVIGNALEHVADDGQVRVSATHDGPVVRIAVDDDGPGIPEAERQAVFERFHRGARRPAARGAGLGLAIVRAVADAHGGRAWAEAGALGGARVVIELPLART